MSAKKSDRPNPLFDSMGSETATEIVEKRNLAQERRINTTHSQRVNTLLAQQKGGMEDLLSRLSIQNFGDTLILILDNPPDDLLKFEVFHTEVRKYGNQGMEVILNIKADKP